MKVLIRLMRENDAEAVAHLSEQLGYPVSKDEVRKNFSLIAADPFQDIFVAQGAQKRVIGWIHIERELSISTGPKAKLAGLVVDESVRGHGIGSLLLARGESWAKERGLMIVRFSSQTRRTEAHRFYQRLGYEVQKDKLLFCERLG